MSTASRQAEHGRALQAARTSKRGSREAEAALLSLDALHKQVRSPPDSRLLLRELTADSCHALV